MCPKPKVHFVKRAFLTALGALVLTGCGERENNQSQTEIQPSSNVQVFDEIDIANGNLGGSYISAGLDSKLVLIVPGSGPTDRDGNSPQGINSNAYKMLAEELAGLGVSSVRVDKRGMFTSRAAGDPNAVTVDIYANDYRTWVDTLRTKTGVKCVWLLGHSEGGLMVSAAAVERTDICGLILVSAMGRPMGEILREQLKANPANKILLEDAFSVLETLESGRRADIDDLHPALASLFYPAVQDFLVSVVKIDPAELAASADLPTLIVQGGRDIQVSETDANKLAAATGGKLIVIEGMNHVLKMAPSGRAGNIATYSNPDLPLADGLSIAIADFIKNAEEH